MSMTYAVEAEGLRKGFGATQAVAGLDLTVREGTVLGLLGPDGVPARAALRSVVTS